MPLKSSDWFYFFFLAGFAGSVNVCDVSGVDGVNGESEIGVNSLKQNCQCKLCHLCVEKADDCFNKEENHQNSPVSCVKSKLQNPCISVICPDV